MGLRQEFSFDTVLGIISCILGAIALVLSAYSYKKCKFIESSQNDNKEFHDSSRDLSQRSAGDIININCDTDLLSNITIANFEASLKIAYDKFEQQSKKNLQQILEQTNTLIQQQKPNIAGLTKIDWINIFFESAKNTSDVFMQKVWANVLAKELEKPGSFSYKSLDTLRNMSVDDFLVFEKLCSMEISDWIIDKDFYSKYWLGYLELIKLKENGLLNMVNTYHKIDFAVNDKEEFYNNSFVITMKNVASDKTEIEYPVYLITSVAKELKQVVITSCPEEYANDSVTYLSSLSNGIEVTLRMN